MSAKCPPINLLRSSTLSRLEVSLLTGHKFWNVHHLLRAHLQSGALKFCCLMHTGWKGRYFFLLFMILHIWVLKVCCLVHICQNMLLFCLSHGLIQLLKGKSLFFVRHSDQINYHSGNICTKFTYYFSKFCIYIIKINFHENTYQLKMSRLSIFWCKIPFLYFHIH